MPETQPQVELTPPLPSEVQAGPPEVPELPSNLDASDLKFSADADVADWAKGKSARDLVDLVETLRVATVSAPAPAPAPAPTLQPDIAPAPASGISADAIYSDTPGFVKSIEAYTNAKVSEGISQAATPLLQPLAGMARSSSMAEAKNKEVWDLYGPEIDAKMSSIPLQSKADPALWNQAVDMVAGEHRDDLAQKAAERLIAASGDAGMITSGGITAASGNGITASPIKVLFDENHPSIAGFKKEGLDVAAVIKHAANMGHAEEVYAEMLKSKVSRRYSTKGDA